jgi:hypothetical protein
MREHWSVQDGVLTYTGKGNNLCTQNPIYFRNIYVRELP